MKPDAWPFGSFFLGGFECSTHLTMEGRRMDLIAQTQHDRQARDDYARCRAVGIKAVREAARWPMIDRKGVLDMQGVRELARLGGEMGLTQIWDLMHYGYPDDLDPFSTQFIERFAAYVGAVARVVRAETPGPTYFTPINEISYTAWAGATVGYMAPFVRDRGGEYKRALVRAAIAAINTIWAVDPQAQMLSVDPLIHLHVPDGRPDLQAFADNFNQNVVTEAFDLLAGFREPELGGSRRHLGIVGINHYACNQWTIPTPEQPQRFLSWDDPNWIPLTGLLHALQARYGGPLIIAETGDTGDGRSGWLTYLTHEAKRALEQGVNLQGICLYPLITSPDWEDPTAFFDGGLFDVVPQADGNLRRVIVSPVAAALREAQSALDSENLPAEPPTTEPPLQPEPPLQVVKPLQHARFKPDNFSYQTLIASESLVVELYGFEPGASLAAHRHEGTEHVLTVLLGEAHVRVGNRTVTLRVSESVLVPAGFYHGIHNPSTERLLVQQVSAPKPWDARFVGPHPSAPR